MVKLILFTISYVFVAAVSFSIGRYLRRYPWKNPFCFHVFADVTKNPDLLFKSMVKYFAEQKPYLDSTLTVKDVARALMTNRTYLGRAIRENNMINFNYFVNSYRIREAIDIFRLDPLARIGETAAKCGFNSTAAFTMAFKLYLNMTPKQWKNYYLHSSDSTLEVQVAERVQGRRSKKYRNAKGKK